MTSLNPILPGLGLEKHPDKVFIGQGENGFNVIGRRFHPEGLHPVCKTAAQFAARLHRLPEQRRTAPKCRAMFGESVRALAGVGNAAVPALPRVARRVRKPASVVPAAARRSH